MVAAAPEGRSRPVRIVSVQSWVAFGHVGNAAALFPLQRLGAEVLGVHTVQFSNHPGHGGFGGAALPAAHVAAVLDGLAARGFLDAVDGVLSGYLGEAETGPPLLAALAQARRANPAALYCCDPVIGDEGPGVYVRPGLPAFFAARAVPQADLLTPNRFELGLLASQPCRSLAETIAAGTALRRRMRAAGPGIVLVSSLEAPGSGDIDMLLLAPAGRFLLRTPRLPITPNGAGDLLSALFLFHYLRTRDACAALEEAGSSLFGVIAATAAAGTRELELIAAQVEFVAPSRRFAVEPC